MAKRKEKISEDPDFVSKSQRKRDAHELKTLASKLIRLTPAKLAQVPLDESVREAIEEAQLIRSNVAGKRQLQFIAKLLRRVDATEIFASMEEDKLEARRITARQHRCEAWRDFLVESGDTALEQLLVQRHDTNAQAIRQLIRNARREALKDKPPSSSRTLFRLLRDIDKNEPLPLIQA